jgi:HAMP domain-containing protein
VLLAKTLRSATFKLALVSIGLFGAVMVALFGYVYWSATTLVLSQTDSTIEAELASLRNTYDSAGRDGLVRAIEQRVTETRIASGLYQLADASFVPIAGNLKKLPAGTNGTQGWTEFRADALNPTAPGEQSLFRARWETLPGGFHLLVGRAIGDVDRFTNEMYAALAFAIGFIFVLAAVASVSVTRRTVGRIDSINTTSRAIMDSGLGKRIPLRGTQDEWDHLAQNLNSMLERIEGLMG